MYVELALRLPPMTVGHADVLTGRGSQYASGVHRGDRWLPLALLLVRSDSQTFTTCIAQ